MTVTHTAKAVMHGRLGEFIFLLEMLKRKKNVKIFEDGYGDFTVNGRVIEVKFGSIEHNNKLVTKGQTHKGGYFRLDVTHHEQLKSTKGWYAFVFKGEDNIYLHCMSAEVVDKKKLPAYIKGVYSLWWSQVIPTTTTAFTHGKLEITLQPLGTYDEYVGASKKQ